MPWITWYTFDSWHSPYHIRSRFYHHPFLEACHSSLLNVCSLFSSISQKRWAKWDQPVAYCPARPPVLFSSSHIPCLGSTLSILRSLHDFFPPFSLSYTGLTSLWHTVRPAFRFLFSHLPSSSSLPLSYPTPIFIGSSPGFLVFREVSTLLNFINLFSISLPFDFTSLPHWRLLPHC